MPEAEGTKARETFGSRFGSLMVLIGVAVGLANVWRFPYLAGKHGGAAFVLLYVVLNFLLGIPAIMAEWTLGRLTRKGPAGAFVTAGMPGGRGIGLLLFFTVFMAMTYYTLIVGQVLFYALHTLFGVAVGTDPAAFYQSTLGGITPWNLAMTAVTFLGIGGVLYLGVRRGIEAISRVAMPLVFLSLLVVIVRSVTLPGAMEGIRFYLVPDLSKIDGPTVLAAMGQVFFSLSLGGTFFLLYGSYLRDDENLPVTAVQTAFGDMSAALLAGLAVLPAVFAMGVEPTSGPSLLFITLPGVFGAMPGGAFAGGLFFSAFFVAAFLSAVAGMEVLVDGARHYFGWSRGRALVVLVGADFFLSIPSMSSSDYLMWNDRLWGSTMQPVGSALTLIALGWFVSRGRALAEVNRGSSIRVGDLWIFWIRWVIPISIAFILVYGWWAQIRGEP
ncbi:MAG TPA: sodium-dependent transporter [Vicinamibacteria bacterium]|nr:sodium-dependent transporter [Vicinamibacteria bacterium]